MAAPQAGIPQRDTKIACILCSKYYILGNMRTHVGQHILRHISGQTKGKPIEVCFPTPQVSTTQRAISLAWNRVVSVVRRIVPPSSIGRRMAASISSLIVDTCSRLSTTSRPRFQQSHPRARIYRYPVLSAFLHSRIMSFGSTTRWYTWRLNTLKKKYHLTFFLKCTFRSRKWIS